MKVKLYNDFHNTEVTLVAKNNRLTKGQMGRSKRELCGIRGCTCSDDFGVRGPQECVVVLDAMPQNLGPGTPVATVTKIDH